MNLWYGPLCGLIKGHLIIRFIRSPVTLSLLLYSTTLFFLQNGIFCIRAVWCNEREIVGALEMIGVSPHLFRYSKWYQHDSYFVYYSLYCICICINKKTTSLQLSRELYTHDIKYWLRWMLPLSSAKGMHATARDVYNWNNVNLFHSETKFPWFF